MVNVVCSLAKLIIARHGEDVGTSPAPSRGNLAHDVCSIKLLGRDGSNGLEVGNEKPPVSRRHDVTFATSLTSMARSVSKLAVLPGDTEQWRATRLALLHWCHVLETESMPIQPMPKMPPASTLV